MSLPVSPPLPLTAPPTTPNDDAAAAQKVARGVAHRAVSDGISEAKVESDTDAAESLAPDDLLRLLLPSDHDLAPPPSTSASASASSASSASGPNGGCASPRSLIPTLPSLPGGFSLCYNRCALDGWVKQRSPACAAASVAGAYNALLARSRAHPDAFNQDRVVAVFHELLQGKIDNKLKQIERMWLGGLPAYPLVDAIKKRWAMLSSLFHSPTVRYTTPSPQPNPPTRHDTPSCPLFC